MLGLRAIGYAPTGFIPGDLNLTVYATIDRWLRGTYERSSTFDLIPQATYTRVVTFDAALSEPGRPWCTVDVVAIPWDARDVFGDSWF